MNPMSWWELGRSLGREPVAMLVLKTSLILAAVWLIAHLSRRRSAAQRHLVWSIGMAIALLAPLWHIGGPRLPLAVLPAAGPLPSIVAKAIPAQGPATGETSRITGSPIAASSAPASLQPVEILVTLYIFGIAILAFHLAWGLFHVINLTAKAKPLAGGRARELIDGLCGELGMGRNIAFLVSASVDVPFTWGAMRPRVLLPHGFEEWPQSAQRNVLIHELAHVRRGDWVTGLMARLAMILHWFNPLSWKALNRLRLEAERACDDLVLTRGNAAIQYADQLLGFAGRAKQTRYRAAMVSMACRSDFSERMLAILDKNERRQIMKPHHIALSAVLVLGLTALLAGIELRAQTARSAAEPIESSGHAARHQAVIEGFHEALGSGHDALHDWFVGHHINRVSPGDGTPLIMAAGDGDREAVALLIENGADVNLASPGDGSPLIQAASRGDLEIVRMLLDAGADVDQGVAGDGNPLIAAAGNGHLQTVELLLAGGADVNGFVFGDETPLIQAIRGGHFAVASLLLDAGADVNKAVPFDDSGALRSPMGTAAKRVGPRFVALLRQHGAVEAD